MRVRSRGKLHFGPAARSPGRPTRAWRIRAATLMMVAGAGFPWPAAAQTPRGGPPAGAPPAAARHNPPAPGVKQAGAPGFNLERLKELRRPRVTAAQRTQLGLDFLRLEMKTPAAADRSRADGKSGHDWAMARIVEELGQVGLDRTLLAEELKFSHPGEFQAALRILLVRAGDREALAPLGEWLAERGSQGWLRIQAVAALEPTRDRRAVEPLWKTAASDPFSLPAAKVDDPAGKEPPGPGLIYPVRRRALQALAAWRDAGVPMSSYVLRTIEDNRFQVRLPTPAGKR